MTKQIISPEWLFRAKSNAKGINKRDNNEIELAVKNR